MTRIRFAAIIVTTSNRGLSTKEQDGTRMKKQLSRFEKTFLAVSPMAMSELLTHSFKNQSPFLFLFVCIRVHSCPFVDLFYFLRSSYVASRSEITDTSSGHLMPNAGSL